jgi:hypothetical protein
MSGLKLLSRDRCDAWANAGRGDDRRESNAECRPLVSRQVRDGKR